MKVLIKGSSFKGAQIKNSLKSHGLLCITKYYFFCVTSAHLDVPEGKVEDSSVL